MKAAKKSSAQKAPKFPNIKRAFRVVEEYIDTKFGEGSSFTFCKNAQGSVKLVVVPGPARSIRGVDLFDAVDSLSSSPSSYIDED